MSDDEDPITSGELVEEILECGVISAGGQSRRSDDRGLVADFGTDELGGLKRALEGAREDYVYLDIEACENTCHEKALLFAFLDEATFGVKDWIFARYASVCVAHHIDVHTVQFNTKAWLKPLRRANFNMIVTMLNGVKAGWN